MVVAEDHEGVRRALVRMIGLQEDMEVVGEAADGREAVRLALALSPDVVLLDVRMPELDGVGVIEELRRARCRAKIIVLSAHEDESYITDAVKSGADSYLLKGMPMQAVMDAVRSVAAGTTVIPQVVAEPLARKYREQEEMLKAFQGLLEMGARRGALLEAACGFFREILEADCASTYVLKRNGGEARAELAVSCRGQQSPYPTSGCEALSASELRSLVALCEGEGLVVCNSLRDPDGEGAVCPHAVGIPIRAGGVLSHLVVVLREKPFSPQPSVLRRAELLSLQVSFMLEACAAAEDAAAWRRRSLALETAAVEMMADARAAGRDDFLERTALLLGAEALCLARVRGGRTSRPELVWWGTGEEGALEMLRVAEGSAGPGAPAVVKAGKRQVIPESSVSAEYGVPCADDILILPLAGSGAGQAPFPSREQKGSAASFSTGVGVEGGVGERSGFDGRPPHGSWTATRHHGVLCARGAYPEGYLEERRELLERVAALAERFLEGLSRPEAPRDAGGRR